MPDTWGQENFGVDHYRPKKYFPDLITTYSNLYYCCNPCNSRKGQYWPSEARAKDLLVPNPCEHAMASHLKYKAGVVEAKTIQGEFTRDLLDLNAPDIVKKRTLMINMVRLCQTNLEESKQMKKVVTRKLKKGAISAFEAEKQISQLEVYVAQMEENIKQLTGRPFL
jgi:hypothetical protein